MQMNAMLDKIKINLKNIGNAPHTTKYLLFVNHNNNLLCMRFSYEIHFLFL